MLEAKSLGEHLKTLRLKSGLTATQAAAAANITERMIYLYEAGSVAPGYHVLMRLAEAYGTTLDGLMKPDSMAKKNA